MVGGKRREERFVVAEWEVRSLWRRVEGRNLEYHDTGEHVTPTRGGTELLA